MTSPRIPCVLLAGWFGVLAAQPAAESPARILNPIPDGTPPAPSPPQPGFSVRPAQVRSEKTHRQGGRDIIVRTIDPIPLPAPASAAPSIDPADPAVRRWLAERAPATLPGGGLAMVDAAVFILPDGKVRTLLHLRPQEGGPPATFWSAADFRLLTPVSRLACDDGFERPLIWAWSFERLSPQQAAALAIPEFPEGEAGFIARDSASDTPAGTLSIVRSLHSVYSESYPRLLAAFGGSERERLRKEAEERAHPPRPRNISLQTWTLEATAAGGAKGGAR